MDIRSEGTFLELIYLNKVFMTLSFWGCFLDHSMLPFGDLVFHSLRYDFGTNILNSWNS
jgi:hypothetical protein